MSEQLLRQFVLNLLKNNYTQKCFLLNCQMKDMIGITIFNNNFCFLPKIETLIDSLLSFYCQKTLLYR